MDNNVLVLRLWFWTQKSSRFDHYLLSLHKLTSSWFGIKWQNWQSYWCERLSTVRFLHPHIYMLRLANCKCMIWISKWDRAQSEIASISTKAKLRLDENGFMYQLDCIIALQSNKFVLRTFSPIPSCFGLKQTERKQYLWNPQAQFGALWNLCN